MNLEVSKVYIISPISQDRALRSIKQKQHEQDHLGSRLKYWYSFLKNCYWSIVVLQCQFLLYSNRESLEKILVLGKSEGKRRKGRQWLRWLDSIADSMAMNLNKLCEMVGDRGAWCAVVHGVAKSPTSFSNWATTVKKANSEEEHSISFYHCRRKVVAKNNHFP